MNCGLLSGLRDFAAVLVSSAWLVAWLMVLGCSGGPDKDPEPSRTRLRRIAQAYDMAIELGGRPPKDAEALKRYFKEIGATEDADAVLYSPRDAQPYVILFGAPLDANQRRTILAYEQEGAQGKRYVLTLSRDIQVLTDGEFAGAPFAQGHKPGGKP